jgi:hypothetical protein
MKIAHRDLEEARQNPGGYVARVAGGGPEIRRQSVFRYWQLAIYEYHKQRKLAAAEIYFRGRCGRFVPTAAMQRRLEEHEDALRDYAAAFEGLGRGVIRTAVRVSFDLGSGVELGGEVGRLDVVPKGGYAAYLITHDTPSWDDQLRMPLLQLYFATSLGVAPTEVIVGLYSYEAARHFERKFTSQEVRAAEREVRALARRLAAAQARVRRVRTT